MSELYEGVVFRSDESTARRVLASLSCPLRLRLVALDMGAGVFGIHRVAGRAESFDQAAVERIAERVSTEAGEAIALFYDNRCGVRASVLYSGGRRAREFGDEDAWWVPLDEDGEPILDGPRFWESEWSPDEEYDCIFSPIDAALVSIGADLAVSAALVKQAFCYEGAAVLAEAAPESNPPGVPR
ncbi:MAG: hypothetical protein ACYC61_12955 [Isosphaeraceae bacterium]